MRIIDPHPVCQQAAGGIVVVDRVVHQDVLQGLVRVPPDHQARPDQEAGDAHRTERLHLAVAIPVVKSAEWPYGYRSFGFCRLFFTVSRVIASAIRSDRLCTASTTHSKGGLPPAISAGECSK